MSKVTKSLSNMFWGVLLKSVTMILPFITKTVMIRTIGIEYLGVGNLFASVIQILNLTEMGISSAILFSMYKPIAESNSEKICALLNYYKKVYRIIGFVILVVGVFISLKIDVIISGDIPDNLDVKKVFILYLINTVSSYFLYACMSVLFTAHQRDDIVYKISATSLLICEILQIFSLIIFRSYYLFVIFLIVGTLINNIITKVVSAKKYPDYKCCGTIDYEEKQTLKRQVAGLFIGKFSVVARNSIDTMIISGVLGILDVAVYGNYYFVMNTLFIFVNYFCAGIRAAVGSNIATQSEEKNYNDLLNISFVYFVVYGTCTVALLCAIKPFLSVWSGAQNTYGFEMSALFSFYFFSLCSVGVVSQYWEAAGLFWENRIRFILETATNLILSIVLIKIIGVKGVILATIVSMVIFTNVYGPKILFRYYFKNSDIKKFFKNQICYLLVTFLASVVACYLCSLIKLSGILQFFVNAVVAVVVTVLIYLIVFAKTPMFKECILRVKTILTK